MGMLSPMKMAIIIMVLLLFFGAKRLPQLARSMGESINEFKKGKDESELKNRDLSDNQKPSDSEKRVS
jgi:sec-independent protein translocase protein TatA